MTWADQRCARAGGRRSWSLLPVTASCARPKRRQNGRFADDTTALRLRSTAPIERLSSRPTSTPPSSWGCPIAVASASDPPKSASGEACRAACCSRSPGETSSSRCFGRQPGEQSPCATWHARQGAALLRTQAGDPIRTSRRRGGEAEDGPGVPGSVQRHRDRVKVPPPRLRWESRTAEFSLQRPDSSLLPKAVSQHRPVRTQATTSCGTWERV